MSLLSISGAKQETQGVLTPNPQHRRKIKLGYHYFATSNRIMYLISDYQWILKMIKVMVDEKLTINGLG